MAKRKLPAASPAEMEVLRIVWQLERATVQDVLQRLPSSRKVSYATVQTLLRRLEAKGYVKHTSDGKAHVFFAAVKKEAVIAKSVRQFIETVFGGEALPLLQHLAHHGRIDSEDIKRLRKIIRQNK